MCAIAFSPCSMSSTPICRLVIDLHISLTTDDRAISDSDVSDDDCCDFGAFRCLKGSSGDASSASFALTLTFGRFTWCKLVSDFQPRSDS